MAAATASSYGSDDTDSYLANEDSWGYQWGDGAERLPEYEPFPGWFDLQEQNHLRDVSPSTRSPDVTRQSNATAHPSSAPEPPSHQISSHAISDSTQLHDRSRTPHVRRLDHQESHPTREPENPPSPSSLSLHSSIITPPESPIGDWGFSWNVLSNTNGSTSVSEEGSPPGSPHQRSRHLQQTRLSSPRHDSNDFVDLTGESPPGTGMPLGTGQRLSKRRRVSESTSRRTPQRGRKVTNGDNGKSTAIPAVEEVDLIDVDDDKGLSKVLEDQRMATIKAQQEQAATPVKLASLQCIICMDVVKDITTTSCGT